MFQFHKVQLTRRLEGKLMLAIKFQFHKVQLTRRKVRGLQGYRKFQFHKVQLTPCPSTNAIT